MHCSTKTRVYLANTVVSGEALILITTVGRLRISRFVRKARRAEAKDEQVFATERTDKQHSIWQLRVNPDGNRGTSVTGDWEANEKFVRLVTAFITESKMTKTERLPSAAA